eukprot:15477516-Alexandrium_andersonii.AAC.1
MVRACGSKPPSANGLGRGRDVKKEIMSRMHGVCWSIVSMAAKLLRPKWPTRGVPSMKQSQWSGSTKSCTLCSQIPM